MPREEYERDFQSDESKREFDELLSQAKEVLELGPSESREEAYERIGHYVVDRCDVWHRSLGRATFERAGGAARSCSMRESAECPSFE